MTDDTFPPALEQACAAYDAAREALSDTVAAWLLPEVAALSARLKGRTVTLYSGNGVFSVDVERRRPLTWGDWNERKAFVIREGSPQGWARWLPAPEFFAHLAEVEQATGFDSLAPIGAFSFRDGVALEGAQ